MWCVCVCVGVCMCVGGVHAVCMCVLCVRGCARRVCVGGVWRGVHACGVCACVGVCARHVGVWCVLCVSYHDISSTNHIKMLRSYSARTGWQ